MLSTQNKNRIIALLLGIIGCIGLSLFFDLYYDMNDDVMMKNILSGIYTGKPEGHNIQMLYPLAFFISLFYRMAPSVPWYGLFLTGCMLLSFYLCLSRVLNRINAKTEKVMVTVVIILLYVGLLLWEMVYVQYTVVCGVLAATASVWLLLTPAGLSVKEFIRDNTISILLVVVAFNLRTEMLLLMAPFIAIAGVMRWSTEQNAFSKENWTKYLTIIGSILVLLGISLGINRIAYGSQEWKEFNAFFDARTNVYDFSWYPDFKGNKEFYQSIGISEGQYNLIDNYNFGLDDQINTEVFNQIYEYQMKNRVAQKDTLSKIKETAGQYFYQMTHFDLQAEHETRMMPYNALVILLYLWLLALGVMMRDHTMLLKIPFMLLCRSVSWFYVLWNGRVVARLTHSMYFIESMILSVVIMITIYKIQNKTKKDTYINLITAVILMLVVGITIPQSIRTIRTEQERRDIVNQTDLSIKEYCANHPEDYYYIDVYSTVTFSEKMFKETVKTPENYDILGGWVSKSPLTKQKEKNHQIADAKRALTDKVNVYFMAEEPLELSWLYTFYQENGMDIAIENTDKLNSDLIINVYKIRNTSNTQ